MINIFLRRNLLEYDLTVGKKLLEAVYREVERLTTITNYMLETVQNFEKTLTHCF